MRVVVVDEHPLTRLGVREVLVKGGGIQVVGEAGHAQDALRLVDADPPDLVITEIALAGMDGILVTREVLSRAPCSRVLILTAYDQLPYVVEALSAGASGYALKADESEMLFGAVRSVARGERYLAPRISARLAASEATPTPNSDARDVLSMLSAREREVFRLATEGLLAYEIARELCISRKTVDSHLARIRRKLGVRRSAELVHLGVQVGLLQGSRRR